MSIFKSLIDALLHAHQGNTSAPSAAPAQDNPTSLPRVWGTLVAQNTADEQKYTPQFRNTVMNAKPEVGGVGIVPGAGGQYASGMNQIQLSPDQLDNYTVTHEGLHAQYQHMTPDQQARFNSILSTATPTQQKLVKRSISGPLYQGNNAQQNASELHSYFPLYNQGNQDPTATKYYQESFGNQEFLPHPNERAASLIATIAGLRPSRKSQFSDYKDW